MLHVRTLLERTPWTLSREGEVMQGFFHVAFFPPSTVSPSLLRNALPDSRLAIPRQGSKKEGKLALSLELHNRKRHSRYRDSRAFLRTW